MVRMVFCAFGRVTSAKLVCIEVWVGSVYLYTSFGGVSESSPHKGKERTVDRIAVLPASDGPSSRR